MIEQPQQIDTNYGRQAISAFQDLMYHSRNWNKPALTELSEIVNDVHLLESAAAMILNRGQSFDIELPASSVIRSQIKKMLADKLVTKGKYYWPWLLYNDIEDLEGIKAMIENGNCNLNGDLDYDLIRASWMYGNKQQKRQAMEDFLRRFSYNEHEIAPEPVDREIKAIHSQIKQIHQICFPNNVYKHKSSFHLYNALAVLAKEGRYDGVVPVMNASNVPGILLRALGMRTHFMEYHREWGDVDAVWMPPEDVLNVPLPRNGNILILENDISTGRTISYVINQIRRLMPASIDVLTTSEIDTSVLYEGDHPAVSEYRCAKDLPLGEPADNFEWIQQAVADLLAEVEEDQKIDLVEAATA